jgi:hypothetical protein
MLHLRDAAGTPVAVGDALGFPTEQWQAEDILVQRHTLNIPPDLEPGAYTLHLGAYRLEDLQPVPTSNPEDLTLTVEIGAR